MTTGAPNTAVTVLMDNSVGANMVRASRSQNRQKAAPPRKQAGIIRIGFDDPSSLFTRCGVATPTKETGPAKATTQADKMLDRITRLIFRKGTLTPRLFAVTSDIS